MPGFVLDSSVALSWLLPDEQTAESKGWLDRLVFDGGIAPDLWPLEVGNALLMAQRRRRISHEQRFKALLVLRDLPITLDRQTPERAWQETMQLADEHGLTLYDANYLELAIRLNLPLATFDGPLRAAAQRYGLVLSAIS